MLNDFQFILNQDFLEHYGIRFLFEDGFGNLQIDQSNFSDETQEFQKYLKMVFCNYRKTKSFYLFEKHMECYKNKLHFYMGFRDTDASRSYFHTHNGNVNHLQNARYPQNINWNKIRKYIIVISKLIHKMISAITYLPFPKYEEYVSRDLLMVMIHASTLNHLPVKFSNASSYIQFSNVNVQKSEIPFHLDIIGEFVDDEYFQAARYFRLSSYKAEIQEYKNYLSHDSEVSIFSGLLRFRNFPTDHYSKIFRVFKNIREYFI